MHPIVSHLGKDDIWDSRTANNQKETKLAPLFQHL
jgi:hypothetical protein